MNERPALTARQRQVMDYITDYYEEWTLTPTLGEIESEFGFASRRAAVYHVETLKKKGYISNQPGKHRSIVILER